LDPLKRALVVVAARCRSPASNAFLSSDTATSSGRGGEVTQPKMHCFCTSPESSWPLFCCDYASKGMAKNCKNPGSLSAMPLWQVAQQKSQQYFSSVKVQQCANRTRSGPLQLRVKKGPDAQGSMDWFKGKIYYGDHVFPWGRTWLVNDYKHTTFSIFRPHEVQPFIHLSANFFPVLMPVLWNVNLSCWFPGWWGTNIADSWRVATYFYQSNPDAPCMVYLPTFGW
jgi:hypothetical protein